MWRLGEPAPWPPLRTVSTVGTFDGVHRGHRHVLARAREAADRLGGLPLVAVTFDPHPTAVVAPDRAPRLLTSVEHRAELLAAAGVDAVLVVGFDGQVARWSPKEFVDRVLVETLHTRAVVVGENFRFGHRAAGDLTTLRRLGAERHFGAEGVELARPWSSTYVRERVEDGDVEAAAEALGRLFSIRGVVVEGDHRGRQLGYPTANVPSSGTYVVPADGVYAGWLRRLDQPRSPALPAAISVGTNPTFEGRVHRVESYVLDRDDLELYGVTVEVAFTARLRGMHTYDSVAALLEQMADDVARCHAILDDATPPGPT